MCLERSRSCAFRTINRTMRAAAHRHRPPPAKVRPGASSDDHRARWASAGPARPRQDRAVSSSCSSGSAASGGGRWHLRSAYSTGCFRVRTGTPTRASLDRLGGCPIRRSGATVEGASGALDRPKATSNCMPSGQSKSGAEMRELRFVDRTMERQGGIYRDRGPNTSTVKAHPCRAASITTRRRRHGATRSRIARAWRGCSRYTWMAGACTRSRRRSAAAGATRVSGILCATGSGLSASACIRRIRGAKRSGWSR